MNLVLTLCLLAFQQPAQPANPAPHAATEADFQPTAPPAEVPTAQLGHQTPHDTTTQPRPATHDGLPHQPATPTPAPTPQVVIPQAPARPAVQPQADAPDFAHLTGCDVYYVTWCNYNQDLVARLRRYADRSVTAPNGTPYIRVNGTWFGMIDCDRLPANRWKPTEVPTLVYWREGAETERTAGFDMTDAGFTRVLARQAGATDEFKAGARAAFIRLNADPGYQQTGRYSQSSGRWTQGAGGYSQAYGGQYSQSTYGQSSCGCSLAY
jgi:hypothetical protein